MPSSSVSNFPAGPPSIAAISTPTALTHVTPLDVMRRLSMGAQVDLEPEWPLRDNLAELIDSSLVQAEDWTRLEADIQGSIGRSDTPEELLHRLVEHDLLSPYQSERIRAGTTYGLILGNYRVLDRIGAGGMGVVFRAEHILMRRIVAIKVLPLSRDQDTRLLLRSIAEMRAISALQHPNIVTAMDAGQVHPIEPNQPVLHYLVMECVDGIDLEEHVIRHGPMDPVMACDLVHQIAGALAGAHARKMAHCDIKPSNIIVTGANRAKLLDFGLARHLRGQLTEQGMPPGTPECMAPEQARGARSGDIAADIDGLGGTLFWCLTGQSAFPKRGTAAPEIARRHAESPPSVRALRPAIPAGLDAVVERMLAPVAADRYPDAESILRALLPFLRPERREALGGVSPSRTRGPMTQAVESVRRVLVVDDDPAMRRVCSDALRCESVRCDEAAGGEAALALLAGRDYDVVILDMQMPGIDGPATLRALRADPRHRNLRVMMASGGFSPDDVSRMLLDGADDYLLKPFSVVQLRGRVQTNLRYKKALDDTSTLRLRLLLANGELGRALAGRDGELGRVRESLVTGLAGIVGHRTTETGGHLLRVQKYCRRLAEGAASRTGFAQIDEEFIRNLEACAPLHDIGNVALPDHILMKPGKLDEEKRTVMQSHTLIGSEILQRLTQQYGLSANFLVIGLEVARSHHEHYNGTGYPDRLVGEQIPLSARILEIGDVYDALRSRRTYRPALSHNAACELMCEGMPGQFDPELLAVFQEGHADFEKLFRQFSD